MSDHLVRLLYASMHITSGMPARGEELRTIRWGDTVSVPRNVLIYKGQIILIFSYNKANNNTNNSFYIVQSRPVLPSADTVAFSPEYPPYPQIRPCSYLPSSV